MDIAAFYSDHPLWVWLAFAAILLAIEVATGSGWLLWAAASAAATGVLTLLGLPLNLPGEIAVFAVLTLAATLISRRFFKPEPESDADINDQVTRLVGRSGEVARDFLRGEGRVFVDGTEWAAEADAGAALAAGTRVKVVGVASGARLRVAPL